jgi:hypothetical protein
MRRAHEKGSENCVADALSRVPTVDDTVTLAMPETRCVKVNDLWTECLWVMPKFDEQNRHPFHFETIADCEQRLLNVRDLPAQAPNVFSSLPFGEAVLVCVTRFPHERLIVIPDAMLSKLVKWHHEKNVHAEGVDRLELSIKRHFWHPQLRSEIRRQLAECTVCARMKKDAPRHGQSAPRIAPSAPWMEAHCDQIGPWDHSVNGLTVKIRALTMIDPVANLVEIVRVKTTQSAENAEAFVNAWLSRCPLPEKILTNGGPEFAGHEWEFMPQNWGLKRGRVSSHTPTADAIIESSHRAMGQLLRTVFDTENPTSLEQMDKVVDSAIAATMRAMRSASTSLSGAAPGAMAFGRDVVFNVPIVNAIASHSR